MRSRQPLIVWAVTVLGLVMAAVISITGAEGNDETLEPVILVAFAIFVLGFATAGALSDRDGRRSDQPAHLSLWLRAGSTL